MKLFTQFSKTSLLFLLLITSFNRSYGQVSITSIGSPVSQNFDALDLSGNWADNSTLLGWYTKTDVTSTIATYAENDGTVTDPALYSFGISGISPITDRAFGFVPNDAFTGISGSGKGYIGWRLKNNTGKTIGTIRVTWSGEQWRKAVDANSQYITLSYQIGSTVTNLTTGTYIATSSSFQSPLHDQSSAVEVDGNDPLNRTSDISIDINVDIPSGSEIMLRWEDLNDPANHTLAIDDVSFNATKESQSITFNSLIDKTYGNSSFDLTATASSGLQVSYTSSNLSVATVIGSTVTITGAGITTFTASQSGNGTFAPALPVERVMNVKPESPTALAANNITSSGFRANWTVANGASGYYLYYSTDPTFTTYTSASVGNVLLYNLSGLLPNTTYYYKLKSINTGIYSDYSGITSLTTLEGAQPTQTYNITQTVGGFTTSTLTWQSGSLTSRILFMREGINVACTNPINNTNYTAHSDWSNHTGTQLGTEFFCIYKGTGNTITLTNLYPGRTYTIQAFEYTGGLTTAQFLTTVSGTNNPNTISPWGTTTFTNSAGISGYEDYTTTARWDHATVPTAALHAAVQVIIDGNCLVSTIAESNNITINAAHDGISPKLSIDAAKSLNIVNTLTNNGSASGLVIKASSTKANGTLTFTNPNSNQTVQASVEMYSPAKIDTRYHWQYFGIPVQSTTVGSTFNSSGRRVRKYDEANIDPLKEDDGLWKPAGSGASMSSLQGLVPFDGYEVVQYSPTTYTFSGLLNTADLNKTLTYTASADWAGNHILANPYTAAIKISSISFGAAMEAAVYIYNTGSREEWQANGGISTPGTTPGTYSVSTSGFADIFGVPALIPSMQGFLVKETGTSTISIPYSATTTNILQQRAPSSTATAYPALRIDVIGTESNDRLWLFSGSNFTPKFDNGWDGRKSLMSGTSQLYAQGDDDNYQIAAVNNFNNSSIGFQPGNNGKYTITVAQQNIQSTYGKIYLVDLQENIYTDITTDGTQYNFTAATTDIASRFKIVTNTTAISKNQNSQNVILSTKNTIFVQNNTNTIGTFDIYNANGKLIKTDIVRSGEGVTIATNILPNGVYIGKLITESDELTQKLIVR